MNNTRVEHLEADIARLPVPEQLWLMQQLARRIRSSAIPTRQEYENDLDAMASDPDIQRELRQIEAEFAGTELDGLDTTR